MAAALTTGLLAPDHRPDQDLPVLIELPRTGAIQSFRDARRDPRATPEVQRALDTFEGLLGSAWDGWTADRQLANRFFVQVQHCPTIEGVRLARQVEDLAERIEARLLRSLVRRLLASTEWSHYVAGATALSFMAWALRAGRAVRPIAESNDRSPDVEVLLHLRPVTLEFKAMHATSEGRLFDDFLQALSEANIDLNAIVGHIPVVPAKESHEALASQIANVLTQESGSAEVSIGDGFLRRRRDPRESIFGPASKDDRTRLLERLAKWDYTEQLAAANGPTVLLVRSQSAFMRASVGLIREWIVRISELLDLVPHIGAVVVVEEGGGPPTFQVKGNVRFLVGPDPDDGVPRTVLLISNDRARSPLTPEELDALASPSLIW
jgi:hypothetical protein